MSKKKNRLPPFIYITKEMFRSHAFKQLSNSAKIALLLLQDQVRESKQSKIHLTYAQTAEYMADKTFGRAVAQLIKLGFIEKTQQGGLHKGMNQYQFIELWKTLQKNS